MERLLIVRLSAMGDVIHALPAAQALRDAFPQAMIGWLIEERWAELLSAPGTPRRGDAAKPVPVRSSTDCGARLHERHSGADYRGR